MTGTAPTLSTKGNIRKQRLYMLFFAPNWKIWLLICPRVWQSMFRGDVVMFQWLHWPNPSYANLYSCTVDTIVRDVNILLHALACSWMHWVYLTEISNAYWLCGGAMLSVDFIILYYHAFWEIYGPFILFCVVCIHSHGYTDTTASCFPCPMV